VGLGGTYDRWAGGQTDDVSRVGWQMGLSDGVVVGALSKMALSHL
jgi:hypothetical protein